MIFFLSGFCFSNIYEPLDIRGRGKAISLTPFYLSYALHRHLDISLKISEESPPLYIANGPTRTRKPWFPSLSR